MNLIIDIGGTFTNCHLVDPQARSIRASRRISTVYGSKSASSNLANLMKSVAHTNQVDAVCIGFPAPVVDYQIIGKTSYYDGPEITDKIKKTVIDIFPYARVIFCNDIVLHGYFYSDLLKEDFAIIGLGTSLGMKVFSNGAPMIGKSSRGGEVAHLLVNENSNAKRCGCGSTGHLGVETSMSSLVENALSHNVLTRSNGTSDLDLFLQVCFLLDEGDKTVEEIVSTTYRPLSRLIASIHLSLGIERFILTGGVAQSMGQSLARILASGSADFAWHNGLNWHDSIEIGLDPQTSAALGGSNLIELTNPV